MKHKIFCIWFLMFLVFGFITYFDYQNNGWSIFFATDILIIVIGIPVGLIDIRVANKFAKKKGSKEYQEKYEKKDVELQIKEIELQEKVIELRLKEKELEALRKQKSEITEDDIRVSRERHFCLVHKGDIKGYSYICPECAAFYCLKCVEAIKEIENECWACGNILDKSRLIIEPGPQERISDSIILEPNPYRNSTDKK